MPSQRPLKAYPDYYGEIFDIAVSKGSFFIAVTSKGKAATLRNELYNYRQALRDEVRKGRATREQRELQKRSEQVKMKVEKKDGKLLLILHTPTGLKDLKDALNG